MRQTAAFALLLALVLGCSHTVVVPVPPRMDLKSVGTLGLVEFASNADAALSSRATREFEAQIHAAQPGTRLVDLGSREALLAAVGSRQLDERSTMSLSSQTDRAQRDCGCQAAAGRGVPWQFIGAKPKLVGGRYPWRPGDSPV